MKNIPYGKQFIDHSDKKLVLRSLSNDLITTGPLVKKFERDLKKYLKCKYSFVCSSGTAAIHLAMLSIGLKKGDIILMPVVNFIASYNLAKIMQLKIYLVDVDEYTGQVTPNKILECVHENKLKKINAVIVMYHGGFPENIEKFFKLKNKYGFYLIEDACHALGASYLLNKKIHKVGSCLHADISTFSLHPVKSITTGEGGVVTTNNKKIAEKIQLYRSHGIRRNKYFYWKYDVVVNGFNYRISDLNCALGISQLKKLNTLISKRKNCYDIYVKELKNFNKNLKILNYSKNIFPAYHLMLININFKNIKKNKDIFIKYLNKKGIFPQYHYIPINHFSVFNLRKKIFFDAEKYYKNSISIPIFPQLKKKEQIKIIKNIKNYFNKI